MRSEKDIKDMLRRKKKELKDTRRRFKKDDLFEDLELIGVLVDVVKALEWVLGVA